MKAVTFLFLLLVLSTLYSCNKKCNLSENDVHVRIHNTVGMDLERLTFGSRMYKGTSSYASCSMVTRIEDVKDGTLTDYYPTLGNHMGYNSIRITWKLPEGHNTSASQWRERFDDELIRNGAVEDSIPNVYTEEMITGLRLPEGHYTYKLIGLSPSGNTLEVEITKD